MEFALPSILPANPNLMKPNIHLSIPTPCSEKWNDFTPVPGGGFCGSCRKTVVDFTKMSDAAILRFISNKPAHTCGRFRPEQLKNYHEIAPAMINPRWSTALKAATLSMMLLIVERQTATAQTIYTDRIGKVQYSHEAANKETGAKHIFLAGTVKDENDWLMPGVIVALKNSDISTWTDIEGRFTFPEPLKPGDVLTFSFIGYVTEEYMVSEKDRANKGITLSLESDMVLMGELVVDGVYKEDHGLRSWFRKVKNWF